MENKANILQELEQISPAIASIGNANVYNVPAGYFNSLPGEVLVKVQMLDAQAMPMPYSVPEGYFDGLAGSIMDKIRAAQGQQPAIQAAALPAEGSDIIPPFLPTPYTVPVGYFDGLADNVMMKIRAQQKNSEVFDELEEIAPLLNTISRQMPYTVPEGYFKQFTVNVQQEEKPLAKVVSINGGRSVSKLFAYMAAACVAVLLVIGGWLYISKPHGEINDGPSIQKQLATVSDAEINEYLNSQPANAPDIIAQPDEDGQGQDIEPVIKNTSTEEIQQYLKENSGPGEKSGKDI